MNEISHIDEWPVTPIQAWMLAQDQADPTSGYYLLPFTWRVNGRIEWEAFTAAFKAMCARYRLLAATVRPDLRSWVMPGPTWPGVPMELRDASQLSGTAREELLTSTYEEFCRRPFRLVGEPPVRVAVVAMAEEFVVMGAFHQAACDIESMAIFVPELWRCYEAFVAGTTPDLPVVGLDFPAYASRTWPSQRRADAAHAAYWRDLLAGAELRCPVPVDYPAAASEPVGPTRYLKIGAAEAARAAQALATELRCSQYAVLLTAFGLSLARRSGQSSLVISCPISQRRTPELFSTFGPLTDTLWLRLDFPGSSIRDSAVPVFRRVLESLAHRCPIDTVAAAAGGLAGPLAAPNLQCQFFPPERVVNASWAASSVQVKEVMPVYLLTGPLHSPCWLDLVIAAERNQEMTDYSLVYRSDLFRPETAAEIADDIEKMIMAGAEGPVAAGVAA